MLLTKPINLIPESFYKNFSCGVSVLDEYLKRFAKSNHKKNIGKTFVLLEENIVIGFYTISMATIDFHQITEVLRKGLPKYPIPVARIGRLALDITYQGNGLGKFLIFDAFERILEAAETIAAYAIVVDAKDEQSRKFYEKFDFISYENYPFSMFLPIETMRKIIQ